MNRYIENILKRIGICSVFMWTFLVPILSSGQKNIKANPYAVQISTQGAFVSCNTEIVTLSKGLNSVRLQNLAKDISVSNISLKLPENTKIISIEKHFVSEPKNDPEFSKIDSMLKFTQDSLNWVLFAIERNKQLVEILRSNQKIEVSDKSIYVDDLDELLNYYKLKYRKLERDKLNRIYHRNQLISQIDSLKTAKQRRIATLNYPFTYVDVQISSPMEQNCIIQINYSTRLASWEPKYTVWLNNNESSLELNGLLRQNTGVNWVNCQIGLSYGENELPSNQRVVNITANDKKTVNNNESVYLNALNRQELKSELLFEINPSISALTKSNVSVTGLQGVYLPKACANYITSTGLQFIDSLQSDLFSDSFQIELGLTNEITFSKELSKEKLKKAIIGSRQTVEVEWIISVINNSDKKQKINLIDILPSYNIAEVETELNLPKGAQINEKSFSYLTEIDPKERVEIKYGFKISAPKSFELTNNYYN